MIRFESDYQEGCHENILNRLRETNLEQTSGYGADVYCERAKSLIKKSLGLEQAEIYFLVGGTQTNTTVIKSLLRPCEGVVCVASGHINVHEAGAIESTGHKVLAITANHDGLLKADELENYLENFYADPTHEHMVQPGMVYLSFPSENGTLYSKSNLEQIKKICEKYKIYLFIDGARLGYGLMSQAADLNLKEFASLCDIFYIGGTKCGALFGEAVVIPDINKLKIKNFKTLIKQQGGLLAKGRLLGLQFEELFKDNLYFDLARHADNQAMRIKSAFEAQGVKLFYDSFTNQQFPVLNKSQFEILNKDFKFELWQVIDENSSAYRFCTSWATKSEAVDALINAIKKF